MRVVVVHIIFCAVSCADNSVKIYMVSSVAWKVYPTCLCVPSFPLPFDSNPRLNLRELSTYIQVIMFQNSKSIELDKERIKSLLRRREESSALQQRNCFLIVYYEFIKAGTYMVILTSFLEVLIVVEFRLHKFHHRKSSLDASGVLSFNVTS